MSAILTCPGIECCEPVFDLDIFAPLSAANPCVVLCNGDTYDFSVSPTGGEGPYTYELIEGTVPNGLTWNATTGTIVGTTTEFGSWSFTIRITDVNDNVIDVDYTIGVIQMVSTAFDDYTVGVPYSFQLQAVGSSGSYTWVILSGTLPDGLTMSPSGLISGTPTGLDTGTPVEIELEVLDSNCLTSTSENPQGEIIDYDGNILGDYDGNPVGDYP